MSETVTLTIPVPSSNSRIEQFVMEPYISYETIEGAGGKLVRLWDDGTAVVASGRGSHGQTGNFGIIPMGYGDIPALQPFWVVRRGPTLARTE
jgi:hypothetical protein